MSVAMKAPLTKKMGVFATEDKWIDGLSLFSSLSLRASRAALA
jgi:hypothetical protein